MNDYDSVLLALEAERHNHRKNCEELIRQRDEARAEVERLTKERDEAKRRADEAEHRGRGWMIEAEDLAERVRELEAQRVNSPYKFDGDSIPASHAEKVLVDVAKAAARIGAEEMREKALGAAAELRARWKRYRDAPLSSDDGSWTARWDAAYSLSEDIETNIKVIPPTGDEP